MMITILFSKVLWAHCIILRQI